ncbi:calcium/calmodulin-dependent protein kinase type II delta 1 chain isoform X3 [Hydra vulgaris]|uniref:Calcium/calmodulin-dependent protein kinase type II delta 1 chain isoform X3 n=1 Tax=Hydra vulgaris TaxID=6087 RepID=A0ABM4BSA4_HYDVU
MFTIKCPKITIGSKSTLNTVQNINLIKNTERHSKDNLPSQQKAFAEVPCASLVKYEVRRVIKLEKTQNIGDKLSRKQNIGDKISIKQKDNSSQTRNEITNEASLLKSTICNSCEELNEKTFTLKEEMSIYDTYESELKKLARELKETQDRHEKILFENISLKKRNLKILQNFHDENKNFDKNIKKLENEIDEEKAKTQRLSIKLEDANFEISRLRTELINAQLENEKIIEENEDLAVDNEDLIKDRDEIIKIYDELFRESERLKHEVNIWKNVFQNNNGDIINSGLNNTPDEQDVSEDEGVKKEVDEIQKIDIEEDQRLLLPPKDSITIKSTDPSKLFQIVEEIARGKFGKVYKVSEISTSLIYAAKHIKVTPKLKEDVLSTIEIMKCLHHVRLMSIFDVYDLGSQIIMILEYVGGRMLFERIIAKNSLTELECANYIKQILQGVHHMHANQICHLDLKPENIVCSGHDTMDIKIIDFSLAKQLHKKKEVKITAGSPEFVAPEILSFDPVTFASDMWSIGVLTYVLLSGLSPFMGEDDNDTLMNVSCGEFDYDTEAFQQISSDAKDFINKLLISQPKKRARASSCLTHCWMKPTKSKEKKINLNNLKRYLDKRKDNKGINAVRAIRRFSSFGIGHAQVQSSNKPRINPSISKNVSVPSKNVRRSLQPTISEGDEEDGDIGNENSVDSKMQLNFERSWSSDVSNKLERCGVFLEVPESFESVEISEDINTPDGLRKYLQRMINQGHLPGSEGPFTSELYYE